MKGLERVVTFIARWTALAGGLVLIILTILTVASVSGRAMLTAANLHDSDSWLMPIYPLLRSVGGFNGLGAKPIPGDFELVEAGTGFAIFAFLPWCHLKRGHATVELLAGWYPTWLNHIIDIVANFLMLAVTVLLAWRHLLGTLDKVSYGETTFILQFPVWWSYAACMVAAAIGAVISLYLLYERVRATITGETLARPGDGGVH